MRWFALLPSALFIATTFGGEPQPDPVARLKALWKNDLSKRPAFQPHNQQLQMQLFDAKQVTLLDITGEAAFERVDGTLAASERKLILFGDLAALRKHAKLKEVHNAGGIGNGFSAYMTPDGQLQLLWIIPEG